MQSFHRDEVVVLDEVQRAPALFATLRGVIDRRRRSGRRNGRFVLLGSATGALVQQSAESLAGRVAYLELSPLSVLEVPAAAPLWLRGGFPDAHGATSDAAGLRWRRQTVARYLDLMADLMLVRRLPPWARRAGKRQVRAPKVHVRDSGLVHALLGLESLDDLLSHPVVGASWEGHVVDNLIAAAPPGTPAWYYRTAAGAGIDLVLESARGRRWAIEIKRSAQPAVSQGFHIAADDIGADARHVVHAGVDAFPLPRAIAAVPLRALAARLADLGSGG